MPDSPSRDPNAKPRPVNGLDRMPRAERNVFIWLAVVGFMITAMVAIGGITRLTGSGLSMVEWHPLMGALPPLNEAQWLDVFEKYQASPQYQQVNHWMTLADFKAIFFWEYVHRLFGRLIGIVFFVPWLVFLIRGQLPGALKWKTAVAFILGGLQGLMGWVMVKSGLVDVPQVSHFRLAAHLTLAFLVASWVLWLMLDLVREKKSEAHPSDPKNRHLAWAVIGLVGLQIVYGAFMAGPRAGFLYATFPDMHGELIPALAVKAGLLGLVQDPTSIHFLHRTLGWTVAFIVTAAFIWSRRTNPHPAVRRGWAVMTAVVWGQFLLGVTTVVLHVPTSVAVIHQVGALVLLASGLSVAHAARSVQNEVEIPTPIAVQASEPAV